MLSGKPDENKGKGKDKDKGKEGKGKGKEVVDDKGKDKVKDKGTEFCLCSNTERMNMFNDKAVFEGRWKQNWCHWCGKQLPEEFLQHFAIGGEDEDKSPSPSRSRSRSRSRRRTQDLSDI